MLRIAKEIYRFLRHILQSRELLEIGRAHV